MRLKNTKAPLPTQISDKMRVEPRNIMITMMLVEEEEETSLEVEGKAHLTPHTIQSSNMTMRTTIIIMHNMMIFLMVYHYKGYQIFIIIII